MEHDYLQLAAVAIGITVVMLAFALVFTGILDNLRHIRAYHRQLCAKAPRAPLQRALGRTDTTFHGDPRRTPGADRVARRLVSVSCIRSSAREAHTSRAKHEGPRVYRPHSLRLAAGRVRWRRPFVSCIASGQCRSAR